MFTLSVTSRLAGGRWEPFLLGWGGGEGAQMEYGISEIENTGCEVETEIQLNKM